MATVADVEVFPARIADATKKQDNCGLSGKNYHLNCR